MPQLKKYAAVQAEGFTMEKSYQYSKPVTLQFIEVYMHITANRIRSPFKFMSFLRNATLFLSLRFKGCNTHRFCIVKTHLRIVKQDLPLGISRINSHLTY